MSKVIYLNRCVPSNKRGLPCALCAAPIDWDTEELLCLATCLECEAKSNANWVPERPDVLRRVAGWLGVSEDSPEAREGYVRAMSGY